MEKAKNLIILLLEVTLALAVLIFITVYIWTSSTENTYKKVLADITNGNYANAASQLKTIPHYKDAVDLSNYIYPISLFNKTYDSVGQQTNGYKMALQAIGNVTPKLKKQSYKNDLAELAKVIRFRIEMLQVQQGNLAQDKLLTDMQDELKLGDIAGALEKINQIDKPSMAGIKAEMLAYVDLLNAENLDNNKAELAAIRKLDPNYSGVMAETIQQTVLKYVDSIKWNELHQPGESTKQTFISLSMNREQIISVLGVPTKSNMIKNKYGTFEKAMFDNYGTLYFEGNKLVAYKENA